MLHRLAGEWLGAGIGDLSAPDLHRRAEVGAYGSSARSLSNGEEPTQGGMCCVGAECLLCESASPQPRPRVRGAPSTRAYSAVSPEMGVL